MSLGPLERRRVGPWQRQVWPWTGAPAGMLLLTVACGGAHPAAGAGCEATEAAILAAAEGLVAADNERDLEAVLDHYTDDVAFITPDGELVQGKGAIRPRYERLFERFAVDIALESEEVGVAGDWAFVRGRNAGALTSRLTGEVEPLRDRFLMILRCEDGDAWRVSRLIWVHESPPRGSARPHRLPGRRLARAEGRGRLRRPRTSRNQ